MLIKHVALVCEKSEVKMPELSQVAAALQKQVERDFSPLWNIRADVSAFARLEDIPLDYWPVIVTDHIDDPSAAGYHEDRHGQPFSLVQYGQGWTLTASHEVLEMLGDPFGRHMVAGKSPNKGQGRVTFLIEVCDPCEDEAFAYSVNGIQVSDFYTPNYFDPVTAPSVRYSYTGSIQEPRQVLKGGYLSWYDPASRQWWQRTWFGGSKPSDKQLSKLKIENGNVREAIDRLNAPASQKAMGRGVKSKARRILSGSHRVQFSAKVNQGPSFDHYAADLRATLQKYLKK